jgi:hypothetical protein
MGKSKLENEQKLVNLVRTRTKITSELNLLF